MVTVWNHLFHVSLDALIHYLQYLYPQNLWILMFLFINTQISSFKAVGTSSSFILSCMDTD